MPFFEPVGNGVFGLLGILIDYLSIAVLFALFYLLFMLFTGGEGWGRVGDMFRGGRDRGGHDRGGHRDGSRRHDGEDGNDRGDGKPEKKARGLDNEHPGRIRVLVTDADDHPIKGADIQLFAVDMPIWRRIIRKPARNLMFLSGRTGPDGLWPSRPNGVLVGSGSIRVQVWSRFGNADEQHLVEPNQTQEPQVIHVTINHGGERSQRFEPHIEEVTTNADRLVLSGRVS